MTQDLEMRMSERQNGTKNTGQAAVVDAIRRAILENDLAPGQRLVEADLCEMLGTSRGTVRAALMDLVHEGLVERVANRGARVRVVGLDEALQVVEVRQAVEALCVMRAAERVTDSDIVALRGIAERLQDKAEQNDIVGFADLTHQAFDTYVRIADQAVAREVLDRLRDRMARHRLRLTYRQGRAQVSLPYWLDIIDALCRRDPIAAQGALNRHVENIKQGMISASRDESPLSRAKR